MFMLYLIKSEGYMKFDPLINDKKSFGMSEA